MRGEGGGGENKRREVGEERKGGRKNSVRERERKMLGEEKVGGIREKIKVSWRTLKGRPIKEERKRRRMGKGKTKYEGKEEEIEKGRKRQS